jgi:hypothetical protein
MHQVAFVIWNNELKEKNLDKILKGSEKINDHPINVLSFDLYQNTALNHSHKESASVEADSL